MRRSFLLPGWARQHYALVVGLIVLCGVVLRVTPGVRTAGEPAYSDHYAPVAAAIGLTQDVPRDAALVTWINAALYAARYSIERIGSSGISAVDYCASFLSDPRGFSTLAEFASLVAGVISIILSFTLVARFVDPVAGVGAAFLLAVHPAAVAFTSGLHSGAFCLLFLLCGLSIAAQIDWREARTIELAAMGLSFGFALDAIPVAIPLFVTVIILGLRATPARERLRRAGQAAMGVTCLMLAALAVIPELVPPAETLQILGLSAAIVAALMLAAHALRSVRRLVGDSAYSSALLFLVLAVGVFAATSFSPQAPAVTKTPAQLASDWLVDHAPAGSTIVVAPELATSVALPRTAQSWQRQFQASEDAPNSVRLYALASARAAAQAPGRRFDVLFSASDSRLPEEPHYLVLPEDANPQPLVSDTPWLVARFRAQDDGQPGVIIWGTQASPEPDAIHVEWRQTSKHMMAALPTQ